jgi:hypothetical protein
MCVDIISTDEYSGSQTQTGCANPNGVPTMMVFPIRVKAGATVQLLYGGPNIPVVDDQSLIPS